MIELELCTTVSAKNCFLALDFDFAIVDDHKAVPSLWNHMLIFSIIFHIKLEIESWCPGVNLTFYVENLPCKNLCFDLAVIVFWNTLGFDLLVLRLTVFSLSFKIDPELETISRFGEACWYLSMNNSFASCHPLHITRSYLTMITSRILMQHVSI